jgi:hypothetical protein
VLLLLLLLLVVVLLLLLLLVVVVLLLLLLLVVLAPLSPNPPPPPFAPSRSLPAVGCASTCTHVPPLPVAHRDRFSVARACPSDAIR